MSTIFARLAGGLGNQLFQFAAAIALRGDQSDAVYLGTASLNRYRVKRAFDMARLLELPSWCVTDERLQPYTAIATRLMAIRIGRLLPFGGISDRNFQKALAARKRNGGSRTLWLDGYFQQGWDWPTFRTPLELISSMQRRDLPVPAPLAADCVIHMRGADFLASAVHCVVDANYYIRAMDTARTRLPEIKTARVVTDDRDYAAAMLSRISAAHPAIHFEFSSDKHTTWLQDFMLMRQARSRIVGNSTFSWWAAALDSNRALTVSPTHWTRGVPRDLFLPWEVSLPVG
ncbi:MAG: alpha-1,2-fucosyltransferase [Betaproteobacteria bacterium]